MSNKYHEELLTVLDSQDKVIKLEELINYTKENSNYPLSEKKILKLISSNSTYKNLIIDWLNGKDDCTPRKLIKKLHAHAKQTDDEEAFQITGIALIRKPMGNPPTDLELKKAQAKRLKVITKKLGQDTLDKLKGYSDYNRKQIDAWVNFQGEIWSQERYLIDHLLLALRHVAYINSDFETLRLFNEKFPNLQDINIIDRYQLEEIRKKTDRLTPEEIAERKQKILDLGLSEEDFSELQGLMDSLFKLQPPIKLWLEAKGAHQYLSVKELFDTLFLDIIREHTRSKTKLSCELFDFLINHKLLSEDPNVLTKYLHFAITTQNMNRAHFVRRLVVDLGAPCDIPYNDEIPLNIALGQYYINPEVFEIILNYGKGVNVYQKVEWRKNALELAEEFSEKHKHDSRYNFKIPLEMLREHSKKDDSKKEDKLANESDKLQKPNKISEVDKKDRNQTTDTQPDQLQESIFSESKSEEEVQKQNKSEDDINQSTSENSARNLVNHLLYDQISTEGGADEKTDELIQHLSLQWSARGKCPIKKSDITDSTESFVNKIVIESKSTVDTTAKHSTAFKLITKEANLELDIENLAQYSPEVISALQNLIAYGIKLDHQNTQKPSTVLEAKIDSLATFIRTILQQPELSAESIQDAYDLFEKEDTNTGTGFYRVYSFFHNKRYDGFHLVKSTTGELVYDLMQALKANELESTL